MASRWMAPKLAKMRRPYTDHELMIMGSAGMCPPPEVLDAIADEKLHGGWTGERHAQCDRCWQARSASGACGCDLYVPAPPRTLPERQAQRTLAVAVDVYTRNQRKPATARKPTARDRKLAQLGLR